MAVKKERVLIGLSGGVDSAVAAARLLAQGYDVEAFFMLLEHARPSEEALNDSRSVATFLGIGPEKYHVWDLAEEFQRGVISPFVEAYAQGLTPNPCVRCNRTFKFGSVVRRALDAGFEKVATGHYARLDGGLFRSASLEKDQSYVLAGARREMLAHALFPLWDVTSKAETRAEASRLGIPVAKKRDSFDICFIHDGDTAGFLRARLGGERLGPILDETGALVGEHRGAFLYTIGQRRGLHLPRPHADGQPRYVTGINVEDNTVTVGPLAALRVGTIDCGKVNWQVEPESGPKRLREDNLTVQFRAHGTPLPARVTLTSGEFTENPGAPAPQYLKVSFSESTSAKVRGVASGQSLVVYSGEQVIAQADIISAH